MYLIPHSAAFSAVESLAAAIIAGFWAVKPTLLTSPLLEVTSILIKAIQAFSQESIGGSLIPEGRRKPSLFYYSALHVLHIPFSVACFSLKLWYIYEIEKIS